MTDASTEVDMEATLEAALKLLKDAKTAPKQEARRIEGKYPCSVFVATPSLIGLKPNYFASALQMVNEFTRRRVDHGFAVLNGCSIISSARNRLLEDFIKSGKTHMLMIDDDIGWDVDAVFKMMESGLDFVAGAVPMRMFNHAAVEVAVANGKTKELHRYATQFNISTRDNGFALDLDETGKAEITFAGTAFIMITRKAVLEMKEKCGVQKYMDNGDEVSDLFGMFIKDGLLHGEDVAFCMRWRAIGGKIYCYPNQKYSHMGPVCVTGMFSDALLF